MTSDLPLDCQPDAALVARYAAVRDEEAFGEVVRRHGPMVLATCTRVLRHRQDAEDAFQAVFIVLAARSRALRRVRSVGGWLHSVAVRVSYGVLRGNRRRTQRLSASQQQSQPEIEKGYHVCELHAVLDEELTALPAKYREALVLCDLEGHTRDEAAHILNASAGTVATWVARGRRRLRERLVRRGVALGAGGLAAAAAHSATAAQTLPAALVQETLRHAEFFTLTYSIIKGTDVATKVTTLAKGELNTMFLSKLSKTVGIVALALLVWFGASPASKVVGFVTGAQANTVLFDDFNDGSATDGMPVKWRPWTEGGLANGTFDASTGDFVLSPQTGADTVGAIVVPDVNLANVSVRTQLRNTSVTVGDAATQGSGIGVRADFAGPNTILFDGGIDTDGLMYILSQGPFIDLGSAQTDLRPLVEDVVLQLDVSGTSLKLFAWRPGEPKPQQPQVQATSNAHASGSIGIYYSPPDQSNGTATFRYVHVSTTPIPEPSSAALGWLGGVALASFAFRRRLGRARR